MMLFAIGQCECILRFEMHISFDIICINALSIHWYVLSILTVGMHEVL